ncbi:HEAT repeat domain-containing protein [Algoriphagus sp. PAP.12]|jgi:hypothetical protein|uniref:HEAT repeat domain-containing protein n=1 Tax=Algoriphagus sp. PAP.12 TaxID=2996678 RepID=UPI00227CB968|nr:HEAT repeat domain-containing protein [Algoriphagus sp. PAP.12]
MAKRTSKPAGQFDPQELLEFLRLDELDYPAGAQKFGKDALPLLGDLVNGSDENLAIKAAYLAGYIDEDGSTEILEKAADKGSAPVRIAAAYGARMKKPEIAEAILNKSLDDMDPSVVKFALRSASSLKLEKKLKPKIDKISKSFHEKDILEEAKGILKKMK